MFFANANIFLLEHLTFILVLHLKLNEESAFPTCAKTYGLKDFNSFSSETYSATSFECVCVMNK